MLLGLVFFALSIMIINLGKITDKIQLSLRHFLIPAACFFVSLVYYHLAFPLPSDLIVIFEIYKQAALNQYDMQGLINRDPLGFGSMALLVKILPSAPESFYLLNMFLWLIALIGSFQLLLRQNLLSSVTHVSCFLFGAFLLFDLDDIHHSMRHSVAVGFLIWSYLHPARVMSAGLFIFAILWQGSLIYLLPLLLLRQLQINKWKCFGLGLGLLVVGYILSFVNFYDLAIFKTLNEAGWFIHFPRLSVFLLDPKRSLMFELAKDIGHDPFWMVMLPSFVAIMLASLHPRLYNSRYILLLSYCFFFVVLLRFHSAMIFRFELLYEVAARAFFFIIVIKLMPLKISPTKQI